MCLLRRQSLKGNHYLGGHSKGSGSGSQHSMFRKLFLYRRLWGLDWNYPSLPVYSFIVRHFISSGRNNYICYSGHYLCNIRVPGKLSWKSESFLMNMILEPKELNRWWDVSVISWTAGDLLLLHSMSLLS